MVKPKHISWEKRRESVMADIVARRGTIVGERFYVIEYTPGYNTGGYYDQDVPAKTVIVSPYFDTFGEALDWENNHEPDNGKTLHIWKDNLYEKTVRDWGRDYGFKGAGA